MQQRNEKLGLENALTVQKLESDKQQAELRQQASELEMQALRAQMSPHFIFNCLSSINRFILKNESEAASDYLTRFSRLIRMVLSNSKKPLIALEDELEMVRLYIEMERLRFNASFDFSIIFKNEIDMSEIFIPPLLLQPFAENAIWHGLMNKEGHKQLDIAFSSEESILTCTITDNGVGRKNAEAFKSKKDVKRKSMGLQITTDRLAKLNMESDRDTFFEVEDLYDEAGQAAGTKIILKIRLEYAIQEVLADQNNYG
jgi:LytS/YehU family sensor histidine kinase